MFSKHRLRVLVLCLGLEVAAFFGVPMRSEEIEDLLRRARQTKLEYAVHEDDDEDK